MFALHPLHVESVAWVSERKDVLSMFFWMLTLWSYARYAEYPQIKRYIPVIGFFALGLMAKPMLVTLPFVLLLLDYWPLKRVQFNTSNKDTAMAAQRFSVGFLIREKAPFFVLSLTSCFITFFAQKKGGAIGAFETHPFSVRVANAFVSYHNLEVATYRRTDCALWHLVFGNQISETAAVAWGWMVLVSGYPCPGNRPGTGGGSGVG
jgi:hypothetical protein